MKKRIIIGFFCICFFLLAGTAHADIIINEVMASNGYYENGNAWDWVELYNDGKSTVDLSGWGFTDSKKDLYKFTFPNGTKLKAGAYLTIWCTGEENKSPGKDKVFYADFRISASGEKLRLTDKDGTEIQKLEMPCDDEKTLVRAAMMTRPKKLIIKRPPKGPWLAGLKPDYAQEGKAVRFDCFVQPFDRIHKFDL